MCVCVDFLFNNNKKLVYILLFVFFCFNRCVESNEIISKSVGIFSKNWWWSWWVINASASQPVAPTTCTEGIVWRRRRKKNRQLHTYKRFSGLLHLSPSAQHERQLLLLLYRRGEVGVARTLRPPSFLFLSTLLTLLPNPTQRQSSSPFQVFSNLGWWMAIKIKDILSDWLHHSIKSKSDELLN